VVLVDRPGSVQTELVVAATGPDRRVDGGWAPFPVLGFVLGGSPNARVDAVLREEKGYTYGIRSVFRPRRRGGLFLTSGSVRGDVTVEALDILLTILDGARHGFTDAETKQGVDYIAMTAASRYATADAIADEAATLAFEGLTTEFTTATLRDLADVDPERMVDAYGRFADGSWTVIVVGDAAAHADGIRALAHPVAQDVTVVTG
jgi:predicted Zn-dependent peptidase